jgi:hypothetical protein
MLGRRTTAMTDLRPSSRTMHADFSSKVSVVSDSIASAAAFDKSIAV